jgi:hypothetical protein
VEDPKILPKQDRSLGRGDRNHHDDDQWDGGEPCIQAENDKQSADDLYATDERPHDLRKGYADPREAAGPKKVWKG